jgi:intracellular septation protein
MADQQGAIAPRRKVNPILKLVLEMGPLALFFIANVKPALFNPLVERFLPPAMFEGANGNVFTATAVFVPWRQASFSPATFRSCRSYRVRS